jgi:hypothetical protein
VRSARPEASKDWKCMLRRIRQRGNERKLGSESKERREVNDSDGFKEALMILLYRDQDLLESYLSFNHQPDCCLNSNSEEETNTEVSQLGTTAKVAA